MSTYTRTPGEKPRGIRKRLLALITVMLMALGFSGLSVLPAVASDTEQASGDDTSETVPSDEGTEDEEEEHDDAEDPVSEEEPAAEPELVEEVAEQEPAPEEHQLEEESASTETSEQETLEVVEETEASAEDSAEVEQAVAPLVAESEDEDPATDDEEDVDEVSIFPSHEEDASHPVEFLLSPDTLTQEELESVGVSIQGLWFEPETDVVVTVEGELLTETTTDDYGEFNLHFAGQFDVGTYLVQAEAGEDSAAAELTVEEGGYSPSICVGTSSACSIGDAVEISQWDLSRDGLQLQIEGFSANSTVELSVGGTVVGSVDVDASGTLADASFTAELEPGEYTLTASSSVGNASDGFIVVGDDGSWDDFEDEPYLNASHEVMSVSQIASEPVEFYVSDYPYDVPVDVLINGDYVETVRHAYSFDYEVQGDYSVGDVVVEFVHPTATLTHTVLVVPDEQGEAPHQGEYPGSSTQIRAGSGPLEEPHDVRDFSFEVDASGYISHLDGEFWWFCPGATGTVSSGYSELSDSDFPATAITVDQPFDVKWETSAYNFSLTGVVSPDGSASGVLTADQGVCGSSVLNWSTDLDGAVPDPEPTPDPTDEPEPTQDPTTDPTDEQTDPAPTEDPTAEPTDPAPTEAPTTDPEPTDEPGTGGIEAPAEAAAGSDISITVGEDHADQQVSVWLYSDPVHLGDPTVSADGTVSVTLPEDASGEHTLTVYTEDGDLIGTAPITITTADSSDGDEDDDGQDGTGTGSGPGGSDDEDPASTGDGEDDDSDGASGESTSGGSADDNGTAEGGLAATGTTAALVAIGAGLLMLLGVTVLTISRRRAEHTAE